jgi:hypothetical protein
MLAVIQCKKCLDLLSCMSIYEGQQPNELSIGTLGHSMGSCVSPNRFLLGNIIYLCSNKCILRISIGPTWGTFLKKQQILIQKTFQFIQLLMV